MKRDMKLIRKIVAEIQNRTDAQLANVEIHGVEDAILARHLEMLLDAKLIEGESTGAYNAPFPTISVKDLSMAGHDFAAVLANNSIWEKLKNTFSASELEALPLGIIKDAGMGLLAQWAKSKLGL